MLRLHGFSSSNYYNIAKLTLLEKGLDFEEVTVYSGAGEGYRPDYLDMSPMGKVPCLETEHGFLSESRCISAYLEDTYPEPPLYPRTVFGRAKAAELALMLDLYVDLPARRLLQNYFSGKPPPGPVAEEVRRTLVKAAKAIARLASFDEFLGGKTFGAADVSAVNHVPFARLVARKVLDLDPFADVPGLKGYLDRVKERPTVARIYADRDADLPAFLSHLAQQHAR